MIGAKTRGDPRGLDGPAERASGGDDPLIGAGANQRVGEIAQVDGADIGVAADGAAGDAVIGTTAVDADIAACPAA